MHENESKSRDTVPPVHAASIEEVLARFGGQRKGLSEEEAAARLRRHGSNQLPQPARRHPLLRFLRQFHNVLIYVLLGAAATTAALGHHLDSAVILGVVAINAIIGFLQEGRAEQALDAIRHMLAPRSTVLRGGARRSIDSTGLVPGDLVLLDAGDKVPADLRLIQATGLRLEEALLTGESVPVEKDVAAVPPGAALGDRTCMAFSGTLVAGGTGRGVVVATGVDTEVGRISGLLATVETLTTPLVRQLDAFGRWLSLLILLLAGILLVYGFFVGHLPFAEVFMAVVGLSVAAIPEGLPAVMTITLAVGVQAMARRHAIVRRLPAIETLGAVSVICSDKTGTLTRNEMSVATVATTAGVFTIEGRGYAPHGTVAAPAASDRSRPGSATPLLAAIANAARLCNDAVMHEDATGWHVDGDPMEGALLAFAGRLETGATRTAAASATGEVEAWERIASIPFDSGHRYMAVLHSGPGGEHRIHAKGAPERILAMCRAQAMADGGECGLDADRWREEVATITDRGMRALALASRLAAPAQTELTREDLEGRLVLLGIVGLIDPPRPEAIAAIAECRTAGIRVKMITGDHPGTAQAIAREVGLEHPGAVLTGVDLEAMSDAELAARVLDTDVFARTSPEHKLRLVVALQAHGATVAMTGDGVNDAPALKRADAGVAMGRKGSEAAKEAADFVLTDDNFASIAAAVREGRTVYDNIQKVLSWTLPTSSGEAATIVVALLFGTAMPITAVQILWVNLITAVTLGLALAFEPTESGTMQRPPRRRYEPLMSGHLLWHVILVSLLILGAVFGMYAYAIDRGHTVETARTIALDTIVVLEIFHLFFIRNIHGTSLTWQLVRGTKVIWICVIAVTAAQFAVTYLPPLQRVFGTEAVALDDGLLVVATGIAFFAVLEIEKQIRLTLRRPGPEPARQPTASPEPPGRSRTHRGQRTDQRP